MNFGTWSDWVQKTINVEAPVNHKPVATIVMNPDDNLNTNTVINFSYNYTDEDNDRIIESMWSNKQDKYTKQGYYQVQLKVRDEKGAWSDWVSKTFFVEDKSLNNPKIFSSNNSPTNQDVIVTINYASTTPIHKYSYDGLTWYDYTDELVISENKTVYAKGIKSNNEESEIITLTITNIDKVKPQKPSINYTPTVVVGSNNGVNVTISYSLDSYQKLYSLDNGNSWNNYTTTFNVKNNCKVLAKGIDRAGNLSDIVETNINNIVEVLQPTYVIEPDNLTNGDVIVTIDYNNMPGKKYKINTGSWQDYTESITITNNCTVYAKAINEQGAESNITNINITNIDKTGPAKATFNASTNNPTNQNITLNINYPSDSNIKQYKIGNNEWQDYTVPLTITDNITVYAKSKDILGNESEISSITIANIDRILPSNPVITSDTNEPLVDSVNISIVYSQDSNQKKYKINNGSWQNYINTVKIESNCIVYAKGIDAAGNESEVTSLQISNINNVLKPVINVNNTNITNQDVIVTIDYKNMLYKKYSFDNVNWQDYTAALTITDNCTIYAKSIGEDLTESTVVSLTISNIDKVKPDSPVITIDPDYETTGNVNVSIQYSDDSSIKKYSYDQITWNTYTTNISLNTNKTIYAKGIDTAGNESDITSKVIDNIVTVFSPVINITPSTKTNTDVTVTIDYQGVLNKKYKIGNNEWQDYTIPFTITSNTTIYAKGIDDQGFESKVQQYNITNIDKTPPSLAVIGLNISTPTKNNITAYINYPSDAHIKQYKINEGEWLTYTGSITITDNCTIYAKSEDNVGNISGISSLSITNIDRVLPENPTIIQDITEPTEGVVKVTINYSSDSNQKLYKKDNGTWQTYTGIITLTNNAIIYAKGIDAAGNESEVISLQISNINHKPVAVITMTPNTSITTSTTIDWSYSNSTDPDQDEIVAHEWEGALENYTAAGEKTVRLRVQDSRGSWSDWASVIFNVDLDWILIDQTIYIQDATEVVDWISTSVTETIPSETRIKYYYSTSNDSQNWSSETENISTVANSRYVKVRISYQRLSTSTNTPTLNSITINCDRQTFNYTPETMPKKPTVEDIGDNANASDIQVSFEKANREIYLSEYRILVVPIENCNTFNVYQANQVTNYNVVALSNTQNIVLRSDLKDINGDNVIENKMYKIYVLAIGNSELVKNQLSEGSDSFAITPKPSNPVIIPNIADITNQDVIVTISYSPTATIKQYKIGEAGTWQNYTGNITITTNTTVYAKCSNSQGIESDISSLEITNIDKAAPSNPSISLNPSTPTNQDVIVTITFTNDSVERLYRVNGGEWLTSVNNTIQVTMSSNGSVEAKNKDAAGNWSNIASANINNIDKVPPTQPTMVANPTAPTTGTVTVTITYSGDSSTKQYSYDQVTWNNYTTVLSLTTNKTVYAKGIDAAGNSSTVASLTVANIVVAGPGSPTVYDTPVNGDSSDVEVRFTSPSNEDNITEYRVYAVKSPNVLTVDQAILNNNYQIDVKTGINKTHRVYLTNTFKDVDGELFSANNTYIFYVLSIANEGYTSVLSTPSAGMKLIVSYAVNFDDVNDVTHQDATKTEILNGKLTLKGVVGGSYTNNLVPAMSSNTSPSGIADASYDIIDAYRAFGGSYSWNSAYIYNTPPGNDAQWISYEFTEPKKIEKYIIKHDSGIYLNNQNSVNTFSFQGSNDGTNWDILDQRTNVINTDWYNAPSYAIAYTFDNNNYYTKYRLHITKLNYVTGAHIDDISMMEKAMGYSNLAAGYYVLLNPINVSNWTTITKIVANITTSSGTYFKYLFSFDGGTTWVRWGGSSWINSVLTSINSYSVATAPTTTANWALTGGFVAGTTQNIRVAIGLKTLYENATPVMDRFTILHQE